MHGISLCVDFWKTQLKDIPDKQLAQQVLETVSHGASIGCSIDTEQVNHMNWPSTAEHYEGVCQYIDTHKATGAIAGSLTSLPANFRTSPLGAFIRKGTKKLRIIHDLSWPPGNSVNDSINKEDFSVVYTSVSKAVQLCQQLPTPWLAKTDLQDAYLACPVKISEANVLGFTWPDRLGRIGYYMYQSIALGLRSSAKIFDQIASALNMICINRGSTIRTIHYLDDILTIGASKQECEQSLRTIVDTAHKCGFKIKQSKTVGPARAIEFLGLVIDTNKKTVHISNERIAELRSELSKWKGVKKCTKRELLSLIGKLQFCSQVMYPGHMFLRRLIESSKMVKSLHYKVHLGIQAQKDINWWITNLATHKGRAWFPQPFDSTTAEIMFTDASGRAAAAVLGKNWTLIEFTGEYSWLRDKDIQFKEFYAVVLGVATFGYQLHRKQLLMNIDNEAVHHCIQAGKSQNAELMGLVRALYYYTTQHSIQYQSCHVAGVLNVLADSLTRNRLDVFFHHNPEAHRTMTRPCRILTDFN